MSWASVLGTELNLELIELTLALAGSTLICLSTAVLFFAYHYIEDETRN